MVSTSLFSPSIREGTATAPSREVHPYTLALLLFTVLSSFTVTAASTEDSASFSAVAVLGGHPRVSVADIQSLFARQDAHANSRWQQQQRQQHSSSVHRGVTTTESGSQDDDDDDDSSSDKSLYPPGTIFYMRTVYALPKPAFFARCWYVAIIIMVVGIIALYVVLCIGICVHFKQGEQRKAKKVVEDAYVTNGYFDLDEYLGRSVSDSDSGRDEDEKDEDENDRYSTELVVIGNNSECVESFDASSSRYYAPTITTTATASREAPAREMRDGGEDSDLDAAVSTGGRGAVFDDGSSAVSLQRRNHINSAQARKAYGSNPLYHR